MVSEPICSISGCERGGKLVRGWCSMHYQRWYKRDGDLGPAESYQSPQRYVCSVPGCGRLHAAHGYCAFHYERWRKHGTTDGSGRFYRVPEFVRFWAKVDKAGPVPDYAPDLGPCWLWTAAVNRKGYGIFVHAAPGGTAHRWAYLNAVGLIPDGLQLDHLCRVRRCVRPSHLEAVTARENILRGNANAAVNARKTHCPQGHPYAGDNLFFDKQGGRYCRTCSRTRGREYARVKRQREREVRQRA